MGRINSVLELTLTPSLPLLPGPAHRPSYSPSQQGTERGRDCITASLSWTKVAENGTIKARADRKERGKLSRGRQKQRKWEMRSKTERRELEETPAGVVALVWAELSGRGNWLGAGVCAYRRDVCAFVSPQKDRVAQKYVAHTKHMHAYLHMYSVQTHTCI